MNKKFIMSLLFLVFLFSFVSATTDISLDWLYPQNNLNVSQNNFFNITINISCEGECGEINVTLDPEETVKYALAGHACDYPGDTQLDEIEAIYTDIEWNDEVDDVNAQPGDYGSCADYFAYLDANDYDGIWAGDDWQGSYGSCDLSACVNDGSLQNWVKEGHAFVGTYGSMDYPNDGPEGNKLGDLVGISNTFDGASTSFGSPIYVVQQHDALGNLEIGTGISASYSSTWDLTDAQVTTGTVIARETTGSGNPEIVIMDESNYRTVMIGNYLEYSTTNSVAYKAVYDLAIWAADASTKGTVSMVSGTTPFYTNITNPYNWTFSDGESKTITWFVNATGEHNSSHEFFVYANLTSNETISNSTSTLNITILDTTQPLLEVLYPDSRTYSSNFSTINYSYSDTNAGYCFYSLDSGTTNFSVVSAGTNFTGVNFSDGENNLIVYCNDSAGNLATDSVTFDINIPSLNLEIVYPTSDVNVTQNETFQVQARVTCVNADCGEVNVSLDPVLTTILFDDFESGQGGWTHDNSDYTADEWELGTPTSGPSSAYSGSNVWGTDLDASYYSSSGKYWVQSPEFSLSGYTNTTLTFKHWYSVESCCDGGIVEISIDNSTWTKIIPEGGYPGAGYSGSPWSNVDYTGTSGDWVSATFDLGDYDGNETVYIRFHFATDGSVSSSGWYLDDFNITGNSNSAKRGLIPMNSGNPFYTSTQNPYNVSLNEGESETITWVVNATGNSNVTYEFFVYANLTSDLTIGNVSEVWNVTIVNFEVETDTNYPAFSNYLDNNNTLLDSGKGIFNVTIENTNGTVFLEVNGTNVTATNFTLNNYNASYDFVSAGNYNYKWHSWGNGTLNRYNFSSTRNYYVIDSCVPSMINSSWSSWTDEESCRTYDLKQQNRSRVYYDTNFCEEVSNTTYWESQNISCDYCAYSIVNSSWSSWTNLTCLVEGTINQSRTKIEYDENYGACYLLTSLESDLWNSGENRTYTEYRNIESCDYYVGVSLNSPSANYKIDSDDIQEIAFNCSANSISELSNISLYLTTSNNESFSLDQTTNISGTGNSSLWEINLSSGNYTWNCFAEDSLGNKTFASSNRTIFIGFVDSDGDGFRETLDKLYGDENSIFTEGFSNLAVEIGDTNNLTSFEEKKEVLIYDSSELVLNFSYNFSKANLNLTKINITKGENHILINLTGQLQEEYNKTVYISDNNFASLCVEDFEINSITEVSDSCDGENETDFTSCLGNSQGVSINNLTCVDEGSLIKISNLKHSAIRGVPVVVQTTTPGSSYSGGSSSSSKKEIEKCIQNWSCSSWSFCDKNNMQTRTCKDLNECENETSKPLEIRECKEILFDVKVDLKKTQLFPWKDLEIDIDLKEVNQEELIDVKINYEILKNNESIYQEEETISIVDVLSYTKILEGLNLETGKYEIRIVVNYGKNQTASSLHPFKIIDSKAIYLFVFGILLILGIGFLAFNWYKLRKEREEILKYILNFENNVKNKKLHEVKTPVVSPSRKIIPRKPAIEIGWREKEVLTLLEGVKKEHAHGLVRKHIDLSPEITSRIISKLIKKGLLKVVNHKKENQKVKWYFHTKNVKADMIDDKLRFEKNMGWDFVEFA